MEHVTPPAPPIPHRTHRKHSHRPSSSSARSAIQPSPTCKDATHHSSSPEVISSLISSLAAISTDAEQHFDQLPSVRGRDTSCPSLFSLPRKPSEATSLHYDSNIPDFSPRTPPLQEGFGVDYGAYKQPCLDDGQSYLLEDTAHPPVVRMSKPRVSSLNNWSKPPILRGSQQTLEKRDDLVSIGRLSTEPGLQPPSPSLSSRRSSTFSRILGRRISKESLCGRQDERPRSSDPANRTLSPMSIHLKQSHSRSSLKEDIIDETTEGWQSTSAPPLTPRHSRQGSKSAATAATSPIPMPPDAMGRTRAIPSRRSSLNHMGARSPRKKSSRHNRDKKDSNHDPDAMNDEDNSTLRRIRELQRQKQKREKEHRKEERKKEMKRSQTPIPSTGSPGRTAPDQGNLHSISEPSINTADEPPVKNHTDTYQPAITTANRHRNSLAVSPPPLRSLPEPVGDSSQCKFGNVSKHGGAKFHPDRRTHSDAQFAPIKETFGTDRPESADSIHDAVAAYLASPSLTQKLHHPETGRVIAFSEVGDPRGFPVICCVGMGMTRYIMAFYDELALTLRLRLITIDRPGVGESEACLDGTGTPLNWPDDVSIVCRTLSISKFSLVAHSAGAVYALATALRLPQQVRGRLHLMGAWIPPSQLLSNATPDDSFLSNSVPYTQKLLRVLPESILKAANSSLISATTSSMSPKMSRRARQKSPFSSNTSIEPPRTSAFRRDESPGQLNSEPAKPVSTDGSSVSGPPLAEESQDTLLPRALPMVGVDEVYRARQHAYDAHLTQLIWILAQRHANPAVDLLVCIERRRTIGFRYADITRACVFHHGSQDSRVPVDNVKWLAKKMRRSEVRVLEGEGHSLMASAKIMGGVLTEISREWEDWARVTEGGKGRKMTSDHLDK